MNHRVVSGGAIICSAVVLYNWAQPLAVASGVSACDHPSDQNTPATPERSAATVKTRCPSSNPIPAIKSLPELFKQQWSSLRPHKLPADMEAEYKELIEEAQTLASGTHTVQALAHITGIPKNSKYYETAQQLQEALSQTILQQATQYYQQANLSSAMTLLEAIPANSSSSTHADELQQSWKPQSITLNQAIAAKNVEDWQGVIQQVESLQNTPLYNSLPVQALLQQAMNNLLAPDPTLLAMASTTSGWSTPTPLPMPEVPSPNPEMVASLPIEPIPESSSLNIPLDDALKPLPPIANKTPKAASQPVLQNSSMSLTAVLMVKP